MEFPVVKPAAPSSPEFHFGGYAVCVRHVTNTDRAAKELTELVLNGVLNAGAHMLAAHVRSRNVEGHS